MIKMKILLYINELSNGGAERVMANLANELSIDNDVVLINSFKTEKEYELNSKISHYYLDNNQFNSYLKKNISRIKKLRKYIKHEKPDIAISFMAEPNFRLLLAKLFTGTKTIISIRNDPNIEYGSFLFKVLAKILFMLSDGIVFQTEDAKKWFPYIVQKKSRIIYNPVKESFYNRTRPIKTNNIVSVGRLTKQKNQELLIRAYSEISTIIPDKLYIYGDGELNNQLKQLITELGMSEKIFLMGNIKNIEEEIIKYKLFVLSSDYEGMPNSLMEAMALGIPCISSDCPCGGPRELLKQKYLFKTKDKEALKKLILDVVQDNNILEKMSEENTNKAKTFRNDVITNLWKEYIASLVNK